MQNQRIYIILLIGILSFSIQLKAQDSIAVKDLSEEKELKFQQHFYKALSEKAIRNYQKAIQSLEQCNQILPNEVSVNFELSKNYLLLNKPEEAKLYVQQGLEKDPENVWMLEHLVAVYMKEYNYEKAIETQKQLVVKNPKMREQLARLYYLNREYDKAITLMDALEKDGGLSRGMKRLRNSLLERKKPVEKKAIVDLSVLTQKAETSTISFTEIQKLLELTKESNQGLFHKYSRLALELFPAQPKSYLLSARSLLLQRKYQETIVVLENGIDFVIDNPKLELAFYELFIGVYTKMNNSVKVNEYKAKIQKLKTGN